jgi:uncharacterized membrane protein YcaP (DUF421 family)
MHTALQELFLTDIPWWSLLIRAIVAYVGVLLLLRISGKRQVAQMGMAEFVALLLISNAVQNSMNGGDNSLVGGLILASVLIVLSYGFQYVTYRSRKLEQLIQGRPTLLIHRGRILHDRLKRELLTVRELRAILRKQGIHDINEIEEAILESDGYVSITKKCEPVYEMEMERNDVY